MKKEFIINTKYEKQIEEFMFLKQQAPWVTLKKFCRDNELNYNAFRKATLRKAYELKKGDIDSYTIIQIPVGVELFEKLEAKAMENNTTIPKIARHELKKVFNAL